MSKETKKNFANFIWQHFARTWKSGSPQNNCRQFSGGWNSICALQSTL